MKLGRALLSWFLAPVVLLVAPMACGEAEPNPCITEKDLAAEPYSGLADGCGCRAAAVAAGTWEVDVFSAYEPGHRVHIVHGPQGGWHFPLWLAVADARDLIRMDATMTDLGTGVSISADIEVRARLEQVEGCLARSRELRVYLDASKHPKGDGSANPNPITCRQVALVLDVEDNAGRTSHFETMVYLLPDTADVIAGFATECPPVE